MSKTKRALPTRLKTLFVAMNLNGTDPFEFRRMDSVDEVTKSKVVEDIEKHNGKMTRGVMVTVLEYIFKYQIRLVKTATSVHYLVLDEDKYKCLDVNFHKDSDFIMLVADIVGRYTDSYVSPEQILPHIGKFRVDLKLRQKSIEVDKRRSGSYMDTVYLDRGDGMVDVITSKGVNTVLNTNAPVLFKTFDGDSELPEPDLVNPDVMLLFKYVNLTDEYQQLMLLVVLCFTIAGQEGYPLVFFTGTAGSGKTEAARLCISLVDNSAALLRRFSEKSEDFFLACHNKHIVGYDNVTDIPKNFMDLLCIAVTNGYVDRRQLWENTKMVQIQLNNPIFMTAIQLPKLPPDVVDRAICLNFERFSNEQRKTKNALYADFVNDASAIFGGLLLLISKTMAVLTDFKPKVTSRLADFSIFGQAMAVALGKQPEDFLNAHRQSESVMSSEALENEVILEPLLRFVNRLTEDEWVGNASELERLIRPNHAAPNWPKSIGHFGRTLAKHKLTLFNYGVDVISFHHNQRRALKVTRLANFRRLPPPASATSSKPPKKPR